MEESRKQPSELDIVFCCDCTSSMGQYITSAQHNIRKIAEQLHAMESISLRYGLVCYRDHPPQDATYATKVYPFTDSIKQMQSNVSEMSAQGGGDGPESVACALHEALKMDYRKNSARVVIIIADAPPHGLNERGDGFPQGCPCNYDPLKVAREMEENKIVIYSVAVEPVISHFSHAKAFFHAIAEITHGRYVTLGDAHLLTDIVVGGSAEEIDMKKFEEEIVKETLAVKAASPSVDGEELATRVESNLQARGIKTWQLDVTHQEKDEDIAKLSKIFTESSSLEEARGKLPAHQPQQQTLGGRGGSAPSRGPVSRSSTPLGPMAYAAPMASAAPRSTPSYSGQAANYAQSPISKTQIQQVMSRNRM